MNTAKQKRKLANNMGGMGVAKSAMELPLTKESS